MSDSPPPSASSAVGISNTAPPTRAERWSRRLIWFTGVALVASLAHNGWDARQQYERLRALQCNQPIFDFGRAFHGRVVEHNFHVINLSRQPVQIERVTAACGCTTVATQLEGQVIEPRGSFDIPVRLDLANSTLGEVERPIKVTFAGEPKLQLTVKLQGTVEAEWTWAPEQVVFEGLRPDKVASRTVTLTQHPEAPAAELGHIAVPAQLRSEVQRSGGEDSRTWTLMLTTVPPLPTGRRDLSVYAFSQGSTVMIGPIRVALIVEESTPQP